MFDNTRYLQLLTQLEIKTILVVSCLDLVSTLNGTLNGTLIGNETKIPKDSEIRDVIVKTVTQLGQCSSHRIGYQNAVVPYDMSWDTGSTVWDILKELRDLYYSYGISERG